MFSKLLVTSVALSATANAMLVPPKLKLPDVFAHLPQLGNKLDNLGPARTGQERATVELACHDCPLAVGSRHGHPLRWEDADGADTTLVADITSDGSQLFFNGAPIYPQAGGPLGHLIAAKQAYADKNASHPHTLYEHALPLSTGIEVHPAVKTVAFHLDTPNAKEVVETIAMRRVTIEILGLANRVVHADTLEIKFNADDLKIHDARLLPYAQHTSPAADQCADILCRVRVSLRQKVAHLQHFIQSQLQGWRHKIGSGSSAGCAKAKAHQVQSQASNHAHSAVDSLKGGVAKFGGKFDAQGHFTGFGSDAGAEEHSTAVPTPQMQTRPQHGHHHAHHHSALHRLAHGAVSFTYHILLPVLFGVAAGMLVSGVGMLVGQIIVFVVRRVLGRSRGDGGHAYEVVLVEDPEALEHELPKYEEVYVAPPAFEADRKIAPRE